MSIEFLINIHQQMTAGNAITELQKTQAAIDVASQKYAEMDVAARKAEQAVARNASQLAAASAKASAAANSGDGAGFDRALAAIERLKAAQAGLSASAEQSRGALGGQAAEVEHLVAAYQREQAAVRSAATAEKAAAEQAKSASAAKSAAEKAAADQQEVAKKKANAPIETAKDIGQAGRALSRLGGPLGGIARAVGGAARGFSALGKSLGPIGAAAAVVSFVFISIAIEVAKATFKLIEFGIAAANASRNLGITLDALGGSKAAGDAFKSAIDDVNLSTGIASDRLLELTRKLVEAKVSAANVPTALRAIAEQESALGSTEGTEKLIDQLKGGAKSASELAKEMDKTFGAAAAKRSIGWDESLKRFHTNLSGLFAGINIEGILKAFNRLVELFDTNTASGRALAQILGVLFEPLTQNAEVAGYAIERVFLRAESAALDLEGDFLELQIAIAATFGVRPVDQFAVAMNIVLVVADAVESALVNIAGQLPVIGGFVEQLSDSLPDIKAPDTTKTANNTAAKWGAFPWQDLGASVDDGIAAGINGGSGKVHAAISGLGASTESAFRTSIDSHSPSKLFYRLAGAIPEGAAEGIDDGAAQVDKSIADMVDPGQLKVGGGSRKSAGRAAITLIFNGVRDAEDAIDRLEDKLADILEGVGYEIGEIDGEATS